MTDNPRRFILGALAIALAANTLRHLRAGEWPPLRSAFAVVVAGVLLALLAEANGRLAASLAALLALSNLLTNGGALDAAAQLIKE